MKKLLLGIGAGLVALAVFADGSTASPPTVYQPTYIYGETPMGVYMGNPYNLGDDMMGDDFIIPNGEPMREMQTQSGEQEQQFQYLQGQEQLMRSNSQEKVQQYYANQQLTESMDSEYLRQIESKTNQAAPAPIVLPTM